MVVRTKYNRRVEIEPEEFRIVLEPPDENSFKAIEIASRLVGSDHRPCLSTQSTQDDEHTRRCDVREGTFKDSIH